MGKKVELTKIENQTKCQVTFSKRRTGLIKKVRESSVSCNADVAFLAFSPSGRVSKFSNQNRIEDVLGRYTNLPAEKRYPFIKNVEEKIDKLKLIDHISGDEHKLNFLNNQIKQMEQQIRKSSLESDLLETCLSEYEPDRAREPSLAQLLWREKELKDSLQRVTEKKNILLADLASSNEKLRIQKEQKEIEIKALRAIVSQDWGTKHPYSTPLLMQLDPWLSPHSPKVRQAMLQELSSQQKRELFAGDNEVKLFYYPNPAPNQHQGLPENWSSRPSQQSQVLDFSKSLERFRREVPLVAQPQQVPAQTLTYSRIYEVGRDGTPQMSSLYGNGTNHHVNSSICGNSNINIGNWNQNSVVNNHVNSSIRGNYNTTVDNGNQNSIANEHVNLLIYGNHKTNVGNWNHTSIVNNHVNSSIYDTKVNNGNQVNSIPNKHVNPSKNGNHNGNLNTNVGNWNQNSIGNNPLDSFSGGDYYFNIHNGNQNSIANKHVNPSINSNHNGNHNTINVGNWNQNSIANNLLDSSSGGNYNSNIHNGNQNSIANKHVNPSTNGNHNGNHNTNFDNWNQNSIANNLLNSSSDGNYNFNISNGTQNSIVSKHVKTSISGNRNTNVGNWNQNSIPNNHANLSANGNYITNIVDNENQINSLANKYVNPSTNGNENSSLAINHVIPSINGNHSTNVGNWNQNSIFNNHLIPSSTIGNYNTQNSIVNELVESSSSGNQNTNVGNWNQNSITNNHVNPYIIGNYNTNLDPGNQNSIANNHAKSSVSGNCNTNVNNWNQNSIANNHVIDMSVDGDNYNAHITKWNQNSIINNNALTSSESVNDDQNIASDTTEKNILQVPIDLLLEEATKGNDIVMSTEGNNGQVGSWEAWDGFALAENLNSEDIDICF